MRFLMPNNPTLVFHYTGAVTLKTTTKTFREAIVFVMKVPRFASHPPIKLVIESTQKTLYFDEDKFQAFLDGDLSQENLFNLTECDGMFRNKVDLVCGGIEVDHYSLWKLVKNKFILVDDDQYVAVMSPDDDFVEI